MNTFSKVTLIVSAIAVAMALLLGAAKIGDYGQYAAAYALEETPGCRIGVNCTAMELEVSTKEDGIVRHLAIRRHFKTSAYKALTKAEQSRLEDLCADKLHRAGYKVTKVTYPE